MASSELLNQLEWRSIGPFRGGRCVAVAGHPTKQTHFYMGTTGGGVWKTEDGGIYWRNLSDGYFQRASVGGIAVSPSDPNVIYVGMGETTIRGNVSHGDGVYKSTDGGASWKHLGLEATRNIGKVRVHPQNPDVVYVAAFGHAHGANAERGVYRSTDGGSTWKLVLHRSDTAGACDISIDPHNLRILYAAFWEAIRGPHYLSSGGEGSGLFRSRDGGDSWDELTDKPGMPKGLKGKIGVAVSPARTGRVWAIVENENGGVFRSDDGGEQWELLSSDRNLRQRAWYYSHVIADPADAETVWVLNVQAHRSVDGGKTFNVVPVPHGDTHDLWIDPTNINRMILGDDGGGTVSFNGGITWTPQYSQPTSEFYHVTTDSQLPYRVFGAQQDNTSMSVPSRSNFPFITRTEWHEVGGGEAGYIAVKPDDPDIVYAGEYQGYMTRWNRRTGQARNISVWPEEYSGAGAESYKYRFQWTYPIIISPHDPDTIYCGGNVMFRSRNQGQSWDAISPDLTRNDPTKLGPSGGPITGDNTGAEIYCTVFTLAESPQKKGVLWAGSDDGLVHLTRDGGKSWANVTPPDLPEWSLVSIIEASPHSASTAYFAANRYKLDDFQPYLFKTSNYGKTWQRIDDGLDRNIFTRVIREDPAEAGVLYAGSETGITVSLDDGASWQRTGGNLPVVPIHDFVLTDDTMAIATHGRAFWIHDDLSLIRTVAGMAPVTSPKLLKPRDTRRYGTMPSWSWGAKPGRNYQFAATQVPAYDLEKLSEVESKRVYLDSGENPPDGVVIHYVLPANYKDDLTLDILDGAQKAIRSYDAVAPEDSEVKKPDDETFPPPVKDESSEDTTPKLTRKEGLNRFVWDMRIEPATKIESKGGDQPERNGPRVVPGTYGIRLTANGDPVITAVTILPDPRSSTSTKDYAAQFGLLREINAKHDQLNVAVNELRGLREQAITVARQAEGQKGGKAVIEATKAFSEKVDVIEDVLLQRKIESMQDSLNYPVKLNTKLEALGWMISGSESAPTDQMAAAYEVLAKAVDQQLSALRQLKAKELPSLNEAIRKASIPAVAVKPRVKPAKKSSKKG